MPSLEGLLLFPSLKGPLIKTFLLQFYVLYVFIIVQQHIVLHFSLPLLNPIAGDSRAHHYIGIAC